MTPQRIHTTLRTAAAVLAVATPAVLALGVLMPLDTAGVVEGPTPAPARGPTLTPTTAPSVESFAAALSRPLRPAADRAAAGAASGPTPDAAPVASPARLRLVGTVGQSVALVQGPDGTVAVVEVGDDVDGADVVTIESARVDLRQNGRIVRLEKPVSPPAGGGISIR